MTPIILDHDIGTNPDDFFELLLLLSKAPERLKLLVSGNRFPLERAKVAAGILRDLGFDPNLSYAGEKNGCVEFHGQGILDKDLPMPSANYCDAIKSIIEDYGGALYLCTQGLSNLAVFLKSHSEHAQKLAVYHMGMNANGFEKWISGGTNMEADPLAAKFIYSTLKNLTVVGGHTTLNDDLRVAPDTRLYKVLHQKKNSAFKKLSQHLLEYHKRRGIYPCMHDPLTAAVALGNNFCTFKKISVDFDKNGLYRRGSQFSVTLSNTASKTKEFMEYLADALDGLSQ